MKSRKIIYSKRWQKYEIHPENILWCNCVGAGLPMNLLSRWLLHWSLIVMWWLLNTLLIPTSWAGRRHLQIHKFQDLLCLPSGCHNWGTQAPRHKCPWLEQNAPKEGEKDSSQKITFPNQIYKINRKMTQENPLTLSCGKYQGPIRKWTNEKKINTKMPREDMYKIL